MDQAFLSIILAAFTAGAKVMNNKRLNLVAAVASVGGNVSFWFFLIIEALTNSVNDVLTGMEYSLQGCFGSWKFYSLQTKEAQEL